MKKHGVEVEEKEERVEAEEKEQRIRGIPIEDDKTAEISEVKAIALERWEIGDDIEQIKEYVEMLSSYSFSNKKHVVAFLRKAKREVEGL